MKRMVLIGGLMVAGCCTMSAQAGVVQNGSECVMSLVGPDAIHLSIPSQIHEAGFSVQMKDMQGNPLSGLEVWFFVDQPVHGGLIPPGTPPLPPQETYGNFPGGGLGVHTDAQGVARSGAFTGGTISGRYDVAAYVWVSGQTANGAACKSSPGPVGYFRVNQQIGGSNAIPTLSGFAPWLLGLILLGVGWFSARRASGS